MYLCLRKTSVALWCTVLLLCVPWSSSEASTNLNGLASTFPSVTVDGLKPPKSTSRDGQKGSSSFAVSQVFGSPLRRQLLQRSVPLDTDDGGTCELTPSQRRRFYSTSSHTWNVSDSVLEELSNDIQSVVSCAASGDIILLPAARRIQPRRTIIISNNITMTAQSEGPLFRNGSIVETANKPRLSCPPSGDLLVIRSGSVLIGNIIFKDCIGEGNVVSIDAKCDEDSISRTINFHHIEFTNIKLSGGHQIVDASESYCGHLSLENIIIRENQCGSEGCLTLSMNNTLTDIVVVGNRPQDNDAMVVPPVFVLPPSSETHATNVSGSRNSIRVFNVINSTFTLSKSHFDGNTVEPTLFADATTTIGGSVLLSNHSRVSITDSIFENNSGLNGGVVYASASDLNLRNCSFRKNEGRWGGACAFYNRSTVRMIGMRFVQNYGGETGGAIYTVDSRVIMHSSLLQRNRADDFQDRGSFGTGDEHGCASTIYSRSGFLSLHDVNVTRNIARHSGTIYVLNSSLVFRRVLVKGNIGGEGVGVYSDHSNITVRHSTFDGNIDDGRGAAMQAMGQSRLQMFDSRIQNNVADVLGGGMYVWGGSDVTLKRTNFTNNTAWGGGACVFGRGIFRLENVLFSLNRAQFLGGGIFANEGTMYGKSLTFYDNHVDNEGGGIYAEFMKSMSLSNVRFYNNSGRQGGGISIHITGSSNGEEIESLEETGVSINNSSFTSCRAILGGAIYSNSCNVKIRDTVLFSNRGKNGGGIYAVNTSHLNATNISLHSNEAVEDGGGMTIEENSSLFCTRCEFTNNIANRGGGVYAWGSDFLLVVAQIQDSGFVHNRAHSYGGGLHFSRPGNTSTNCSVSDIPCSRVVLLNTKFVKNVAGVSGAAMFTTDPKGVLVSCQRNDSKSTFLNEDQLKSLSFFLPNNSCSSWRRNRVRKNPNGDIVGTDNGRKEAP